MKMKLSVLILVTLFLLSACGKETVENRGNNSSESSDLKQNIESQAESNTESSDLEQNIEFQAENNTASSSLKPEYKELVDEIYAAIERGYHYQSVWRKGDYAIALERIDDYAIAIDGGNIQNMTFVVEKRGENMYMAHIFNGEYFSVVDYDRCDDMGEELFTLIQRLEAHSSLSTYEKWGQVWDVTEVKLEKNQDTTIVIVDIASATENQRTVYHITDGLIEEIDWNDSGSFYSYNIISGGPIDGDFIVKYYDETKEKYSELN